MVGPACGEVAAGRGLSPDRGWEAYCCWSSRGQKEVTNGRPLEVTDPAAGTASVPQKERNPSLVPCPSVEVTLQRARSGCCLCRWGLGTWLAMGAVPRCFSSASVPRCRSALTSYMGPKCHEERPPCRVQGDRPEVPVERLSCGGEALSTTTKRLHEMSAIATPPQEISDTDELPTVALPVVPNREPSPESGKDPSRIKLPPWLGKWGTSPEKDSPTAVPALPPSPPTPAEKPSQSVPQRSHVTRDWQKEVTP